LIPFLAITSIDFYFYISSILLVYFVLWMGINDSGCSVDKVPQDELIVLF